MFRFVKTLAVAAFAALLAIGGAAAQEVRIGVVMATTGTFAFVGVPVVNAVRLAHDEITAANGYGAARVSLVVEDNRSVTQEAIALINRMATRDNALAVIGPVSTGEAMAAGPVAVNLRIPMFTTATAAAVLAAGPWVFKVSETPEQYMAPLGRHVAQQSRPRSCFLVFIRDNEGYIRQKDVFRDTIRQGGVNIAAEESILAADSDFTALATNIARSNVDCLFLSTPPEQGANLVIQARQAGMAANTLLVGNTGMSSDRYVRAGGRAVEGSLIPAEFVPQGTNDLARNFVANYTRRFNSTPDHFAAQGYTMMYVLANAIRSAGANVTRDSVREAMARTRDLPVVLGQGRFSFDENRSPTFGSVVLVLREGRWVQP
jgi:branched-chain amino acid transport system substrate-binding protein